MPASLPGWLSCGPLTLFGACSTKKLGADANGPMGQWAMGDGQCALPTAPAAAIPQPRLTDPGHPVYTLTHSHTHTQRPLLCHCALFSRLERHLAAVSVTTSCLQRRRLAAVSETTSCLRETPSSGSLWNYVVLTRRTKAPSSYTHFYCRFSAFTILRMCS